MQHTHRLLRLLSAVATIIVVVVAFMLAGLRLTGGQLDVVHTGSMAPAVPTGSLAVSLPVSAESVEVGDVVTFAGRSDDLVMHRVVEVFENQGLHRYRTQGDANRTPDPGLLREADIERRVVWSAPGLGWLASAVQPPVGLLWLVGLPLAIEAAAWASRPRRGIEHGAEESAGEFKRVEPVETGTVPPPSGVRNTVVA